MRAVLEDSWKWTGAGGQPDWGQDGTGFEALYPTYRVWLTITNQNGILAPLAELPPNHAVFQDLVQQVRGSMWLDIVPAGYGTVPELPRTHQGQVGGTVDR